MYKVIFKYENGKKGTCIENGTDKMFDTQQEAEAFATDLNNSIEEDMKPFFPVWYAEKV